MKYKMMKLTLGGRAGWSGPPAAERLSRMRVAGSGSTSFLLGRGGGVDDDITCSSPPPPEFIETMDVLLRMF